MQIINVYANSWLNRDKLMISYAIKVRVYCYLICSPN